MNERGERREERGKRERERDVVQARVMLHARRNPPDLTKWEDSREYLYGYYQGVFCDTCSFWLNGYEQYWDHLLGFKRKTYVRARWEILFNRLLMMAKQFQWTCCHLRIELRGDLLSFADRASRSWSSRQRPRPRRRLSARARRRG